MNMQVVWMEQFMWSGERSWCSKKQPVFVSVRNVRWYGKQLVVMFQCFQLFPEYNKQGANVVDVNCWILKFLRWIFRFGHMVFRNWCHNMELSLYLIFTPRRIPRFLLFLILGFTSHTRMVLPLVPPKIFGTNFGGLQHVRLWTMFVPKQCRAADKQHWEIVVGKMNKLQVIPEYLVSMRVVFS